MEEGDSMKGRGGRERSGRKWQGTSGVHVCGGRYTGGYGGAAVVGMGL
jgi:hypothetical protein